MQYELLDGTVIATDKADLTDGSIAAPINVDETEATVDPAEVWTSTGADGTVVSFHCGTWDNGTIMQKARYGDTTETDEDWTDDGEDDCDAERRLYCFFSP